MVRDKILLLCAAALLCACTDNYVPSEKSMLTVKQDVYDYQLYGDSREVKAYAVDALENGLRSRPLKRIIGAEIISNDEEFIHSKGYEQIQLALWRKGLTSEVIHYAAVQNEAPLHVNVRVHYRDIGYPETCPNWAHSASHNYDNSRMSGHGCATTVNLGHMLERPEDLLDSRGSHNAVSESSVAAVERMHQGEFVMRLPDFGTVTTDLE